MTDRSETAFDPVEFSARMAAIVRACSTVAGPSLAQLTASAIRSGRMSESALVTAIDALGPVAWQRLLYDWRFWGRPKQQEPVGNWDVWLELAGRGFGKNRLGSEWIVDGLASGECRSAILIGPTFDDAVKYMVGGRSGRARNGSGVLDVAPPWLIPDPRAAHNVTRHEIRCANGAMIYYTSAEKPELRGANIGRAWCDEICMWHSPEVLLDNLALTLREKGGARPRTLITTTPRPMDLLREIIMDAGTVTIHGTTDENAENVHAAWLERMTRKLGGTRLGRQELEAEILGDNPDALFTMTSINLARVSEPPTLRAIVVAVDPALSTSRHSDETGIVVEGVDTLDDLYVLADLTGRHKPEEWGTLVAKAARDWGADVVVERTAGGQLVAANVRAAESRLTDRGKKLAIHEVEARGDKRLRAEPLATLYEQGRVHHVGHHPALEAEITEWDPRTRVSPNRLDALVHGANHLCPDLGGKRAAVGTAAGLDALRARLVAPTGRSTMGGLLPRAGTRATRL